jgi:CelD/BcsL family acetyltransferase involved in cellulose biosynthesis
MRVDILTEPSCFNTLAKEWHDLLGSAEINHIFITPEFQEVWWKTLGNGELQVITIRTDQGQLVGIAPLFRFRNSEGRIQLSFIGCVDVSDYLDFIVHREHKENVYQQIVQYLQGQQDTWQDVFLCSIPHNSPSLNLLEKQTNTLNFPSWQWQQTQQDVCPVINLPGSWDEYLAAVGKKQRHEIKRKWEKLFRETQSSFEEIRGGQDLESAITDFISLHQKSSQEKKSFWDEAHEKFFYQFAQRAAEKQWLRLYFLRIDDRRVACMLGFEYNNLFYLYNSGFDADQYYQFSVGNVLTAYTIQQAIEAGNARYDFLRGDEEYKFRFGAVAEPVYDLKLER